MLKTLEDKLLERFPKFLSSIPFWKHERFQHGDGWFVVLYMALQDLEGMGEPFEICTIKEKFGTIRVYPADCHYPFSDDGYKYLSDQQWDRLEQLKTISAVTCELCGQPGETRWEFEWIRTLCEEHKQTHNSPRRSLFGKSMANKVFDEKMRRECSH